jgi:hypothetical protein
MALDLVTPLQWTPVEFDYGRMAREQHHSFQIAPIESSKQL